MDRRENRTDSGLSKVALLCLFADPLPEKTLSYIAPFSLSSRRLVCSCTVFAWCLFKNPISEKHRIDFFDWARHFINRFLSSFIFLPGGVGGGECFFHSKLDCRLCRVDQSECPIHAPVGNNVCPSFLLFKQCSAFLLLCWKEKLCVRGYPVFFIWVPSLNLLYLEESPKEGQRRCVCVHTCVRECVFMSVCACYF